MKKKAEGMSLRETFAIHRRAARDMRRIAPGCFTPFILCAVVEAASPYAVIWLSARLVDELSTLRRPEILAKWVLWIVAVSAAAELLKAVLERWKNVRGELLDRQKEVLYTEKFLRMDYADCDRQETRDLFSQIRQNAAWSGWGFAHLKLYYTQAVQGITGILGAAALTVSLFTRQVPTSAGKLTALNHPLFLVGILLLIAAVTCLGPALVGRAYSAWNTLAEQVCFGNRVFSHFAFMRPGDKEKDMDRRMYRQNELAEHYVRTVNIFGVGSPVAKASQTTVGLSKALAASLSAVLSGVVYVFVCLKALGGAFGIGSVTQYVSAVTTFSGNAALLLSTVSHMRANAEFLKAIYTFLDIPNSMYQGSLTTEKRSDRQYDVEFRDVSFRYPGSDIWALRHVNMRFKVGKRLAIVGENGSGKTTFIKLLCRLYDPQEGQILLNGIDIRKYRYDDYMGIFSVVFQDFQLICQPLGNNVAGSMEYDRDRARKALIDAGFADRLAAMEKGLDTMLYKNLSEDGVEVSGGEAQRIRLATQIGSGLVGVAYILDEPSIGLHQRDNDRLLGSLMKLRDLGNSLIVVEHDEDTMRAADCIVDIGPGAGEHGGQLVAMGTAEDLMKNEDSITGAYLSGKLKIPVPLERRKPTGFLTVKGAAENNLKNIDVKIPLGIMTCITGVSGSGKSSLINEILYKRLARDLNRARVIPGKHKDILGTDQLDKVINIDQSPIGRTPRSNPATYTGVFDQIRDLFAATADAKAKGYKKGRFSFNVKGGRCEACSGDGIIKIEMHFLPDVYVPCEVCKGKRYNRETLEVKYKDKNIYDVLNMTVEEALTFFENVPSVKRKIQTLYDVGLSYIRLGQPSTELSGGEAQRIKLATELSKRSTGKTIYILDEPTTGLHFADVHKLVEILKRLSEGGNTVVVIEHNLDVIKTADYIIDIGPEGGDKGGTVVAQGTPEEVAQSPVSYTGKYVKKYLK